jgi:hypothetical protein
MNLSTLVYMFAAAVILTATVQCAQAGSLTPYLSLGAYHRDCQLTDPMICDNDKMGSDTPGTIDLGVRLRGMSWVDTIDIGWHHQSYVDRGSLIVDNYGGNEAQIDMWGVRFTWEFQSLQVTW